MNSNVINGELYLGFAGEDLGAGGRRGAGGVAGGKGGGEGSLSYDLEILWIPAGARPSPGGRGKLLPCGRPSGGHTHLVYGEGLL